MLIIKVVILLYPLFLFTCWFHDRPDLVVLHHFTSRSSWISIPWNTLLG